MRLRLVAAGTKMPDWVRRGWEEYAKRLPRECRLELREIPLARRGRGADEEGERMLAALRDGARVVTLEVEGTAHDTPALARRLAAWMQGGKDIELLVGGPGGLSRACRERADENWSLSALTLPHALVRIVVAEQLYRAWSLLNNHPYHRG